MSRLTFVAMGLVCACAVSAIANIPGIINFQGVLRDGSGNLVPNSSYGVTFRIYDDAGPGGTVLWSEVTSVTTTSGLFTVLLGAVTPVPDTVFNNPDRWLGIQMTGNGEMFPRTQLSSVGSALVAQWNSSGQDIYRSTGKVGIGTSAPTEMLTVAGALDVSGNIKSDNKYVPAGEENLRIVRGIVASDGTVVEGTGFQVSRIGVGQYVITFDTPFLDVPVVTATCEYIDGVEFPAYAASTDDFASWVRIDLRSKHDNVNFLDQKFHFIAIGPR